MPHARAWADIERKGLGVEAGSFTRDDDGGRRHGRSWRGVSSQARRLHDESNDRPESCRHFRVQDVVDEALAWQRGQSGDAIRVAAATADRLAVSVGIELLRLVPGYVSTEVDGNLSLDAAASVARAHQIIDAYKQRGVGPERVLIKLVSTVGGTRQWLETDCAPPHEQGKRSYMARRLFIGEAYDRTIHQIPRRLHRPPRRAHQ